MPGFFESMKRIAQGKPVFDASDELSHQAMQHPTEPQHDGSNEHHSLIQKGNDRTFPVVYVKRTVTRMNGPNMQVHANILNTWPEPIELEKVHILGATRHLEVPLRPNEERDLIIYDGPRPRNKITEADIEYKTHHEHDYFKAIHDVTFLYHDDHTYSVDELHLRQPIRDIYG
jgi:hypothetical protein